MLPCRKLFAKSEGQHQFVIEFLNGFVESRLKDIPACGPVGYCLCYNDGIVFKEMIIDNPKLPGFINQVTFNAMNVSVIPPSLFTPSLVDFEALSSFLTKFPRPPAPLEFLQTLSLQVFHFIFVLFLSLFFILFTFLLFSFLNGFYFIFSEQSNYSAWQKRPGAFCAERTECSARWQPNRCHF